MRINVYAEELTTRCEWVSKAVSEGPNAGQVFYGVRFYLDSPASLHHTRDDDDASAVTVWVPWTKERGHNFAFIELLLQGLHEAVRGAAEDHETRSGKDD